MLDWARECTNLKSLVHCSTAYVSAASAEDAPLREACVPSLHSAIGVDATTAHERIRRGEVAADEAARWLAASGHPNTYTFTKCLAEELLVTRRGSVPLCIVRPSIISASHQHPMPGWIDSQAAFAAWVCMFGRGWLHSVCAEPSTPCDIVPCDYVAARLLTAAFDTPIDAAAAAAPPPVLYAVAGREHSLSVARIAEIIDEHFAAAAAESDRGDDGGARGKPYLGLVAPAAHPDIRGRIQDDIGVLRGLRDESKAAQHGRAAVQYALLAKALSRLHEVFPHFHRTAYRFVARRPMGEALPGFDAEAYVRLAVRGIDDNLLRGGAEGRASTEATSAVETGDDARTAAG